MMSRRDRFLALHRGAPRILPSMLLCDFGNLQREIRRLEKAGADALHLDVMDGHFVPNFTYGMPLVAAMARLTSLPVDVHLMMTDPDRYVEAFYEAGAWAMSVHAEAVGEEAEPVLEHIRRLGAAAGLALNPDTPLQAVEPYLSVCDFVLVMSVPAGFGGQPFHEVALMKLDRLRQRRPQLLLEVDGGVNMQTVGMCRRAGAQLLVAGSAILGHPDYEQAVAELRGRAIETTDESGA